MKTGELERLISELRKKYGTNRKMKQKQYLINTELLSRIQKLESRE